MDNLNSTADEQIKRRTEMLQNKPKHWSDLDGKHNNK